MEIIKLNKKQLKVIEPLSQRVVALRYSLADISEVSGLAAERLFENIRTILPELKGKDFRYNHIDKRIEVGD